MDGGETSPLSNLPDHDTHELTPLPQYRVPLPHRSAPVASRPPAHRVGDWRSAIQSAPPNARSPVDTPRSSHPLLPPSAHTDCAGTPLLPHGQRTAPATPH